MIQWLDFVISFNSMMSLFSRNSFSWFIKLCLFLSWQIAVAEMPILIPAKPMLAAKGYILKDFHSGEVLAEKNSSERLAPASLTKIMTAYVVFKELGAGNLSLDEKVTISENAWKTPGSRMFVEVGTQVTVENLLQGMIIQSGNDASVALAEHVAGNETIFASMMNQHAQQLGLTNTLFANSMGLPAENHYTTAEDLAKLAYHLIKDFPEYYRWDSQKEFTYNKITQPNRNRLLWKDPSVDGIKTGYTKKAGYCMVTSAKRGDMRLIAVVMGTNSESARANESQTLLNYGFRFFETHRLFQGDKSLKEARVWQGANKTLQLGLKEDLYVTIAKRNYKNLKVLTNVDKGIVAPITKGAKYGSVDVKLDGKMLVTRPLIALTAIPKGSFVQRLYDKALLLME